MSYCFNQRHGAFVDQPVSAGRATKILENCAGWRVDTNVRPQEMSGEAFGHLQQLNGGHLPAIGESMRRTDMPNAKLR